MRQLTLLLIGLFLAVFGLAKQVTFDEARIVADFYFSHYSGKIIPVLDNSFSVQYNGITVYHVFNYAGGGFVVSAADDAVTPVLAESNEGYIGQDITNPSTRYWFESYSKEIEYIVHCRTRQFRNTGAHP